MSQTKRPQDAQDTYDMIVKACEQQEVDPDRHISIQIDDSLRQGISAAMTAGKKATVAITIDINPAAGASRRVSFAMKHKATIPKAPVPVVEMFADKDTGKLFKADPNQMGLKGVPQADDAPKPN